MDDLISRQAAIDAVCMEWCNVKHKDCKHPFDAEKDDGYWCDGCETVLQTLSRLPSVQPVKHGKWIEDGYYGKSCVCSNCGGDGDFRYKFCPWCGSRIVAMSLYDSSAPAVREERGTGREKFEW